MRTPKRMALVASTALVVGTFIVLTLRDGALLDGCFAYTAPAPPLRSTDVVMLREGERMRVTNDHVSFDPSFNPSGDKIVFTSGRDGQAHPEYGFERLALFTANLQTGVQERLTNQRYDQQPDWSPDESQVVFVRSRYPPKQNPQGKLPIREELWTIDVETKEEQRLLRAPPTPGDPFQLYSPVWSPDGERIAFSRADHKEHSLWVMSRDGSDRRRLLDDVGSYFDSPSLSWSPDGEQMVFGGSSDEQEGIYVIDVDTGRVRLVEEGASYPVWGPDGSTIAFFDGLSRDRGERLTILDLEDQDTHAVEELPTLPYVYGRLDWAACG